MNLPCFDRYVGIDYSGAETPVSSLKALRVYMADRGRLPAEVSRPLSARRYWSRRGIAEWLVERLSEPSRTLVGIDHGFSFPLQYFEKYQLTHDWPAFLDDFQLHWPTDHDHTYVEFVREGVCGNGAARCGNTRWRRITEQRAGAKSVFHFDVPGRSRSLPTPDCPGCATSACTYPTCTFGLSMAGRFLREAHWSRRSIRSVEPGIPARES